MTAPSRSAVRHASTKLLPEPTSAAISFALWDIHLVTFFVGTWTLLGALGVSLRLRTSPDLLVENTERQTQRRDGESGVLDGEHKRMGGHAFERALLMWSQDLGWQCVWIGKEGISGLGVLPINTGLIDRSLGLGAKGFGQGEQAPIQARIAQVYALELTNAPASINSLCHWFLHQAHDYLARKCTAERRRCHVTQHKRLS